MIDFFWYSVCIFPLIFPGIANRGWWYYPTKLTKLRLNSFELTLILKRTEIARVQATASHPERRSVHDPQHFPQHEKRPEFRPSGRLWTIAGAGNEPTRRYRSKMTNASRPIFGRLWTLAGAGRQARLTIGWRRPALLSTGSSVDVVRLTGGVLRGPLDQPGWPPPLTLEVVLLTTGQPSVLR